MLYRVVSTPYLQVTRGYESVTQSLSTRATPTFAAHSTEYVAKFSDIEEWMQTCDGMWFSGRAVHSWIIRIATISNVSHAGIIYRAKGDEKFIIRNSWCRSLLNKITFGKYGKPRYYYPKEGEIVLLHMIEGKGCLAEPFKDAVAAYPGQYYWSPVQWDKYPTPEFDPDKAIAVMLSFVGKEYGLFSVSYEGVWHTPLLRELMYWWRHDKINVAFDTSKTPPYCSDAQSLTIEGGGVDPVPEHSHQLTTPQDTLQSLFWGMKVALTPG